jgi:uncharacterized protein (DUF1778 family)
MGWDGAIDSPLRGINLRIREDTRNLIDRAAKVQGKSRSDFMIEAARRAAEEVLLDQTLVRIEQETYDQFLEVLDQPPGGAGFARLIKSRKARGP